VLVGESTGPVVCEDSEGLRGGDSVGNCANKGGLGFGGLDFSLRFGRGGPFLNLESGTGAMELVLLVNIVDSMRPRVGIDTEFLINPLEGD
jgi:hypothetical protein